MDWLKRVYFKSVSSALKLVAVVAGNIHAPWSHRLNSYADILFLYTILERGDIIVTRKLGELTTLIIPGFWKHSLIYLGDQKIIHAITPKVNFGYLEDVIMSSDYYAVLRLYDVSKQEIEIFCNEAESFIGKPYDLNIDLLDDDEVFCSEVIYHSARRVKGIQFLEPRMRMGYPAFTPQDLYQARSKFDLIFDSNIDDHGME